MLSQFPEARAAISDVLLVENSDSLRATQATNLQPWAERNKLNLAWKSNIDEVDYSDKHYTMIVAHEFFDALPFHLLQVSSPVQCNSMNAHSWIENCGWVA